jgi:hypothetical protein
MPNRTIYILDGDIPKWEKIRNRSAWIHERLNEHRPPELTIGIASDTGAVVVSGDASVTNNLVRVPNVPKPAEMTDIRWLNHLKKHGLDPNASLISK